MPTTHRRATLYDITSDGNLLPRTKVVVLGSGWGAGTFVKNLAKSVTGSTPWLASQTPRRCQSWTTALLCCPLLVEPDVGRRQWRALASTVLTLLITFHVTRAMCAPLVACRLEVIQPVLPLCRESAEEVTGCAPPADTRALKAIRPSVLVDVAHDPSVAHCV